MPKLILKKEEEKPEESVDANKKMCQVIIELIIIDKYGNRGKSVIVNGNSWTKQAAQNMRVPFNSATESSVRDVSNILRTLGNGGAGDFRRMDLIAPVASQGYGIVIGTGSTAANRDDFAVETVINEGSGAGQMNYQATSINTPLAITNGYRVVVERSYNNNSGGSISLRELCVIGRSSRSTGVPPVNIHNFLLLRDIITAFPVADGNSVLVKYNFDFKIA